MALNITGMAPEQLTDLIAFVKNGIAALGGLLTAYIIISLWRLWMTRKNQHILLSLKHDIAKIKKKLKIK